MAWHWVHSPWCWGREQKQPHGCGVQTMGTPLPAMAVPGFLFFGWALTFLWLLQSVHEKSCRSFFIAKTCPVDLLLIHARDTLCGWSSQQRPLQATSLSLHKDRHSQRGQITSPEKPPRCGWDLSASCARAVKEKGGQDSAGLSSAVVHPSELESSILPG